MKNIELNKVPHSVKIGDVCGDKEPNLLEDALFLEDGEIVGFYLASINDRLKNLCDIADTELRSKRVPKSTMKRSSGLRDETAEVLQYSTIIGSCPPKPQMRRPYPSISSVHQVDSAKLFIKCMLQICQQSEDIIQSIAPKVFEKQQKLIQENVPEKYRFGRLFTSSISNYNIAAPFHRDAGNITGCVNVIIAKRWGSTGGHTTVPDYDLTVNSADNSMLVYPAWKNVHGVTPIRPTKIGGYRNTLVFYPLKAFKGYF
jgi:hypothetical protein